MDEPRTPERDRASQRERERVNRLQMSSPDERRQSQSQRGRVLNPPFFPDLGNRPDNVLENDLQHPIPFLAVPRSPPRVQYHYPAPWPYAMNVPVQPAAPYQPQYPMPYNPYVNPYPPQPVFPNYPAYPPAPVWGNYADPMQIPQVIGNLNMHYPVPVPAPVLPNPVPLPFEFPPAPLEQLIWPLLPVAPPAPADPNDVNHGYEPAYIPPNLADLPATCLSHPGYLDPTIIDSPIMTGN